MNNDDLHSNYDGISSVIPNVKNTIDNQNANASQENSSNEYNSVGSSEPVGIVPTVLPPSVNSSGIVNQVNDEDGVIFKPFIEELNLLNEDTTGNVSDSFSEPTNLSANDQPVQQPNVVVDKLSQKKEIDKPQKVKSVQVPVEYKPPGFFKKFLMLLMFLLVLGIIIFLPQIEEYIEQYNSSGGDIDNVILDGKMSCNYDTNDNGKKICYNNCPTYTYHKPNDNTCYYFPPTSDCYFKDFSELLKFTLNISLKNIAMEEEIKLLRNEVNYGRNKQDI